VLPVSPQVRPYSEGANSPGLVRRFRVGVIWNLVAAATNQGSTFAANIYIASLLGQHHFGEFSVILGTVQLLATFASVALGYAATRYLSEHRDTDPIRAGRLLGCGQLANFIMASSAAALLFGAANLIALQAWLAPELAAALRIGAIAVLFVTLNGYLIGVLGGLEAYRALGLVGILSGVIYFISCVLGAQRWGTSGALGAIAFSSFFQFVVLQRAVILAARRGGLRATYRPTRNEVAILRRFVLPGALSAFSTIPVLWATQAMLTRQPNGVSELALYAVAYNFMVAVLFLPNVANTVGMTLLNHVLGQSQDNTYHRVFWLNLKLTITVVICGALAVLAGSHWLLGAFGASFRAATPTLALLLAATLPESLTIATNQLLQSRERMWTAIIFVNVPRDTVMLVAALLLVPSMGARGLAAAYLLGRLVAFASICVPASQLGWGRFHAAQHLLDAPR
jgi:O-antigen/teichoic acid export membrane protein